MHTKLDAITSNQATMCAAILVGFAGVACSGPPSHENQKPAHGGDAGMREVADSDVDATKLPPASESISPVTACTMEGIGATTVMADAPVTILDVSAGTAGTVPYCLVKAKVDVAVNIWVAMPTGGKWNGRLRSEGGGGYLGSVDAPLNSVEFGYVGIQTDTGHTGEDGSFGMLSPGVANTQLQIDFAYRSEHLMAVVGKQLVRAFYGQAPAHSYWSGCSGGGRQGMMMAQRYPEDYDGIVAGAPGLYWDRLLASQIWPQMVMNLDLGAPMSSAKQALATSAAVKACDANDGMADGIIDDPRRCPYNPVDDAAITHTSCTTGDDTCLTVAEAVAIEKIWSGARNESGTLLWPGIERGTSLAALAGPTPFPRPVSQARYWVYLDPIWDWKTLTYENYEAFFQKSADVVGPLMATDNPDLSAFKARGGKLISYHGWADPFIMPQGTIRYFDALRAKLGGAREVTSFAKLFMVPGMSHCGGGDGANQFGQATFGNVPRDRDHDLFQGLVEWVEQGAMPESFIATKFTDGFPTSPVQFTRLLCEYPMVAKYNGNGSTDDATNFSCAQP